MSHWLPVNLRGDFPDGACDNAPVRRTYACASLMRVPPSRSCGTARSFNREARFAVRRRQASGGLDLEQKRLPQ